MKNIALILLLIGCEVELPHTVQPVELPDIEENRITFITEWIVDTTTLTVLPQYQLMPTPVMADRIHIEVIAAGVPIYNVAFPFGAAAYTVPWIPAQQIQIVYAYVLKTNN